MSALFTLARITFLQQFRNRLYWVVILFGVLLIGASLLFGALAADQELRVIEDLGLATAEFFGLAVGLFGAVSLVLEETESKTIYLLLTRPFPRWLFILGRFLGLMLAIWASLAIMETLHLGLLFAKGWKAEPELILAIPMTALKIMVLTALAMLCSMVFTSAPTASVFAFFFWFLGHFTKEIQSLAEKSGTAALVMAHVVNFLLPNFSLLNLRDHLEIPGLSVAHLVPASGYALLYTAACLIATSVLFSRKEF